MLPLLTPIPLIKRPTACTDPDWLFEVKHVGFRSLAYFTLFYGMMFNRAPVHSYAYCGLVVRI